MHKVTYSLKQMHTHPAMRYMINAPHHMHRPAGGRCLVLRPPRSVRREGPRMLSDASGPLPTRTRCMGCCTLARVCTHHDHPPRHSYALSTMHSGDIVRREGLRLRSTASRTLTINMRCTGIHAVPIRRTHLSGALHDRRITHMYRSAGGRRLVLRLLRSVWREPIVRRIGAFADQDQMHDMSYTIRRQTYIFGGALDDRRTTPHVLIGGV